MPDKKTITIYIAIIIATLIAFTALTQWVKGLIQTRRDRKQFIWQQEYLERLKQEAEAQREAKKYKNSEVSVDNPELLNLKEHSRIFMFAGEPGEGKTESMKMFGKFLIDLKEHRDHKMRFYNKYMRPEYLKEKQKLIDEELLNLYDNLGVVLENLKSQPFVLDVLTQLRKAAEDAVLMLDEAGHYLPKEVYFQIIKLKNHELKDKFDRIVEFVRFIRHYINGYLLMTEQDEDHVYIGVKRTGMKKIECRGSWHYLSDLGKKLQKVLLALNAWTPAILHHPIRSQLQILGSWKRLLNFFMLISLMPNVLNRRIFFEKQDAIKQKMKEKYELHKVKWFYNNKEQYFVYTNEQTFKSDSRARKREYPQKFNNDGFNVSI